MYVCTEIFFSYFSRCQKESCEWLHFKSGFCHTTSNSENSELGWSDYLYRTRTCERLSRDKNRKKERGLLTYFCLANRPAWKVIIIHFEPFTCEDLLTRPERAPLMSANYEFAHFLMSDELSDSHLWSIKKWANSFLMSARITFLAK